MTRRPRRSALLVAVLLAVVPGTAPGAYAETHWKAILLAGDNAALVFDNATREMPRLWHRLLILLPTPEWGGGGRRRRKPGVRCRACWPEDRSARSPRGSAPDCPGRQENGGGGSIESGPV